MWLAVLLAVMAVLAAACGGDDGDDLLGEGGIRGAPGGNDAADGPGRERPDDVDNVDNCALLTDEEVSAWAGLDLTTAEQVPVPGFPCMYQEPGGDLPAGVPELPPGLPAVPGGAGALAVGGYVGEGDAASAGDDLRPVVSSNPDVAVVTELSGADVDAVAVSRSDDDFVYYVVARQGDLFVELFVFGLFLTLDSPEIDQVTDLAAVALDRLESAR